MMTAFHAGFTNELVKQAGIRDIVKRVVGGKPVPKMGFFQRRRIAKALGIKPDMVERALLERQKRDRLTKGLVAAGGGLGGALLGSQIAKQADDAMVSNPNKAQGSGNIAPAASVGAMLGKRDALMAQRAQAAMPKAPTPAPAAAPAVPTYGEAARRGAMLGKRDALMDQRRQHQQQDLLKRRDDLMAKRRATTPQPGPVASR